MKNACVSLCMYEINPLKSCKCHSRSVTTKCFCCFILTSRFHLFNLKALFSNKKVGFTLQLLLQFNSFAWVSRIVRKWDICVNNSKNSLLFVTGFFSFLRMLKLSNQTFSYFEKWEMFLFCRTVYLLCSQFAISKCIMIIFNDTHTSEIFIAMLQWSLLFTLDGNYNLKWMH